MIFDTRHTTEFRVITLHRGTGPNPELHCALISSLLSINKKKIGTGKRSECSRNGLPLDSELMRVANRGFVSYLFSWRTVEPLPTKLEERISLGRSCPLAAYEVSATFVVDDAQFFDG